jgi:hypothetical protein
MTLSRRKFLRLSAAAAAAIPVHAYSQSSLRAEQSGSKKKGLGLGARTPDWAGLLTNLRCKWVYTWTGTVPSDLPEGMDFIPMIRGKYADAERVASVAEQAREHGITELLGFNEPDAEKQDDMTVEQALDAWPLLMESGLRLGSPGCIHPDSEWMIEFMAGVEERKLRVDFVCVHSYGGPSPQAFINRLEKVEKMYDRPLWITEFGIGDWKARSVEENQHSPRTVLRFMEKVLPTLDRLDFLERYAWFPSKPDSSPLGTSALFDADGVLTPLGECYRDA